MGTPIVVLVTAAGPEPAAVRDVLRDWVGLGLVRPFLAVEAADVDPGAAFAAVVAAHVQEDRAPRVRLQDHLADQHDVPVVRLVAVSSAGAAPCLVDRERAGHLTTSLAGVTAGRVAALHCVLVRHGAGARLDGIERPGWQTLVVAPEDAFTPSPRQARAELLVGGDDAQATAHAAAAVASAAGLWVGVDAGPFDADGGSTGSFDPVVLRAFLRRLDAAPVEDRLRALLTDVRDGLPRPRSGTQRCDHLQDPGGAAADVASRVLRKHADLLRPREERAAAVRRQKIGAWQAVLAFLSFVLDAVRRAPDALADRVAAGLARRVQAVLLGPDSRLEVVVRGVTGDGLPPGVAELDSAARDVQEQLAQVVPTVEQALPDVAPFWRDVVHGALTLADAGERDAELAPVLAGSRPGVVRETSWVAPRPGDAFALPRPLAARLQRSEVDPYDVRLHEVVADGLAQADEDGAAVGAFTAWRQRVTSTYTGVLGLALERELRARQQRLADLLEVLGASRPDGDEGRLSREQQGVRAVLWRWTLGVLAVVVLCGVLHQQTDLGLRPTAALALLLLALWTGHAVLQVLALQRAVFELLNRRQERDRREEDAARQLASTAAGLHVATTLYQQYVAWAGLLARFLQEPFGPAAEPAPAVHLDGLLPRAVGFGVAEPDDRALAEVVHELGTAVFARGWLSDLWQQYCAEAADHLGRDGLAVRDDPLVLLRDPGAPGGLLDRWAGAVAQGTGAGGAGLVLWQKAREHLLARGSDELCDALFTRVRVQAQEGHGLTATVPGRQFFTQLSGSLQDTSDHAFAPTLFSPTALARGLHRVVGTTAVGDPLPDSGAPRPAVRWLPGGRDPDALDLTLVVLQVSAAVPAGELHLRGPARAPVPVPAHAPHDPAREV